jgi:hypothetical protein
MLSYSFLKTAHIFSAFFLTGMALIVLTSKTSPLQGAMLSLGAILTAVLGLFLIGSMQSGLQNWMILKFLFWALLMAVLVVSPKLKKWPALAPTLFYIVIACLIYLAVYKPF